VDYFRCPPEFASVGVTDGLSADPGYFRFEGATCFGRRRGEGSPNPGGHLPDLHDRVERNGNGLRLPFDFSEIVTNLREERYVTRSEAPERLTGLDTVRRAYYFLRPILPVSVRKHLQRLHLRDWHTIVFPGWPVDCTVDTLMDLAMALAIEQLGVERIPFIWFWPEGVPSCAIMTHDVEHGGGRDFCGRLMDIDQSHGVRSSFQIVPERRYSGAQALADEVRGRGFEVNVHDLSHDSNLFRNHDEFLRRAAVINEYGHRFHASGFRSAAMYRRQEWFSALEFQYDMSVPSVAHLEPQRGGCCTVMPYFIGDIVELPLTTIQDYSLFHILGEHSISLWKTQIERLLSRHGLISFITHPDYLVHDRPRLVYSSLLDHLGRLCDERKIWLTVPAEVASWWRSRSQMQLVPHEGSWRIDGPQSHRARLAYMRLEDNRVVYELAASS
jgi:hypothetical protein